MAGKKPSSRNVLVPFLGAVALFLFGLNFYTYLSRHFPPSPASCVLYHRPPLFIVNPGFEVFTPEPLERLHQKREHAQRALEEAQRRQEAETRRWAEADRQARPEPL